MLNVYFTVDVELWCQSWYDLDRQFARAFRQYIHGPTAAGAVGLPFQIALLNDHGLAGVFFTEALFAARFGIAPLQEIVGLIEAGGQEVQLHLHTEWVDEARLPLLPGVPGKRAHLRHYSGAEQAILIEAGLALLDQAGAHPVSAFRAGSFGLDRATLLALAANAIGIDSSYNASILGPDSGLAPGSLLHDVCACEGVAEVPLTVFDDGTHRLRHVQLTACTCAEIEGLLWQALEQGRQGFVILSHSAELLTASREQADPVVVARMRRLCAFLERHRDVFCVQGLRRAPAPVAVQPGPLVSPRRRTAARMLVQGWRALYG